MSTHKTTLVNVIAVLTAVLTAVVLVIAAFSLPAVLASRDNSDRVAQGNDEANCRARYSGAVTDARQKLDDARADLQVHQFDAEVAGLVTQDELALQAAVLAGDRSKSAIATSREDYSTANQRYQNLLLAEDKRRDLFNQMCKAGPP